MRPEQLYRSLFREVNRELRARDSNIPELDDSAAGVTVRADQLGEGYAMPTDAGRQAAELMIRNGGLPASLTYTAKTMAALMADAGRGVLAGQNTLFWNTYNSQDYPELPEQDDGSYLPADMQALLAG
jgi:1-aminocyclopropane-1-carboxylate deaminase/D-cysteine desulfhydrase-like pyridoxal-dependent ACC family enzyme